MPDYGKNSGRDLTDNMLRRLDALESELKTVRGTGRRSAMDRGDTAAMPSPVEGQTMIQYDTGTPKYYESAAWHDFGGGGTAGTEVSPNPVIIPVLSPMPTYSQGGGFEYPLPSTVSPTGGVLTNRFFAAGGARTPALHDFWSFEVNLGPKGSIWGLHIHFLQGPDCGVWQPSMGTSVTPNASRVGFDVMTPDGIGTLTRFANTTFLTTGSTFDGYFASQRQSFGTRNMAFRIGGDPGDNWTTTLATDPDIGCPVIDGGPGTYILKCEVTGKNGLSSGYAMDVCSVTFWRLDDYGLIG